MSAGWGAVASAVGDLAGQRMQNVSSAKQAYMSWERDLYSSSTAHQREVADLRAAGLNPILSGTGGHGAPSTRAPMAPQVGIGTGVFSSAIQAGVHSQQQKTEEETTRLRGYQADVLEPVAAAARKVSPHISTGADAVIDAVREAAGPVGTAAKGIYDGAVSGTTDVIEKVVGAVGASSAAAAGKIADILKVPEAKIRAVIQRMRETRGLRNAQIPPATRGKPMGRFRGKLGGAQSWDYGPDVR